MTETKKPHGIIVGAAHGMGLLKPLFQLEAGIQAAVLGLLFKTDKDAVRMGLDLTIANNKVLIYTYAWSPFSMEALALLDASGYEYTKIELAWEFFLMGGDESETRVALAEKVEMGPLVCPRFYWGKCIGGCAQLPELVEKGELDALMKAAGVPKKL